MSHSPRLVKTFCKAAPFPGGIEEAGAHSHSYKLTAERLEPREIQWLRVTAI
jgi:hypothetical protein